MNLKEKTDELREIKLKAWNKATKKMYEVIKIDFYNEKVGYLFADPITQGEAIGYFKFSDIDLMGYTEFKDKNGVDIYEGDILEFTVFDCYAGDYQYRGFLEVDKYGKFIKTDLNNDEFTKVFDFVDVVVNDDELTVIGNIYENPELLEVEEWQWI